MNLALLFSLSTLIFSILLLFNRVHSRVLRLTITFFVILSLTLIVFYYMSNILTNNGFDESIVFHLKMGLSGSDISDFWQIIIYGFLLLFVVVLVARYTYIKIETHIRKNNFIWLSSALILLFYSILSNPIINDFRKFFIYKTNNTFYNYYKQPELEVKSKAKKKNIVYIYAESLERTYFDESLFPDLIVNLKQIEKKSISFDNIFQIYATGWTLAGMTASQCGMPLVSPTGGNAMSGFKEDFLPLADCMGDLLHNEGYRLEYYGGSSLKFAGKGNFYTSHSFDKVQGKEELSKLLDNKEYMTGWGLYDDSLLKIVYDEFELLSQKEDPFALFTLTLDTHHPKGHPSKQCIDNNITYEDGSNSMLNAVKCADHLLSEFIGKILASPYAKDTVIVLSSDHLAMPNLAKEQLEKGNRRNLFMIIDGENNIKKQIIHAKGSMLDIAPTLLSVLGYKSSQMALGRNLFSQSSLVSIDNRAEKLEKEKEKEYIGLTPQNKWYLNVIGVNAVLASWRNNFLSFWKYPTLKDGIEVNINSNSVLMNNINVHYPVVFVVDKYKKITPNFNFNSRGRMQDIIMENDINSSFIWVDDCTYMKDKINIRRKKKEICIAIGNRNTDNMYILNIENKVNISKEVLENLLYNNVEKNDMKNIIKRKTSKVFDHIDTHRVYAERCHSSNIKPEEIIQKYASEDILILISAYKVDINSTVKSFSSYMNKEKSVFSNLEYDDLYIGIIKNRKLIFEKSSSVRPVKYMKDINGMHIEIETTGLSALFKSSIKVNGFELSPNYAGTNMVMVNLKTGDTNVYNFPTYPKY